MKLDKLNQVLRQAVKNSKDKNYHGGLENAFPLEDPNSRVIEIIKEEKLFQFSELEETKESDDSFIKQQLTKRSNLVSLVLSINENLTPGQVAYLLNANKNEGLDL